MKKAYRVVLGLALLVGAAFLVDLFWIPGSASVLENSPGDVGPIPTPRWLAADLVGQRIVLRWRSVPGALAYTLWRAPGPEEKFRVVHMGRDTTFTDSIGLDPGMTWCYQLTATDPEFGESAFSSSRCLSFDHAGDPESR